MVRDGGRVMGVVRLCAVAVGHFSMSPLRWSGCHGWCVRVVVFGVATGVVACLLSSRLSCIRRNDLVGTFAIDSYVGLSPMAAGCTGKRVLILLLAFLSKRVVRVLRIAIAVLVGSTGCAWFVVTLYFAKIGPSGSCWFR